MWRGGLCKEGGLLIGDHEVGQYALAILEIYSNYKVVFIRRLSLRGGHYTRVLYTLGYIYMTT